MAKGKKRKYYRRYKRYRQISSNYLRVKVEYFDRLAYQAYSPFSNEAIRDGGPMIFLRKASIEGINNRRFISLGEIQTSYTYDNALTNLFSYYRPTGIRIEVVPEARNNSLPQDFVANNIHHVIPTVYAVISYRAGNNNAQTLGEAVANNQSIVLNANEKSSRYWKIYGGTTAYVATSQAFSGGFTIANEYPVGETENEGRTRGMMVYSLQPSWSVKISIYYLYKYSKA